MENVNLSPASQAIIRSHQESQNNKTPSSEPIKRKDGKKLILAGAAALSTVGIASILLLKNKNINKAKEAFFGLINQAQKGNNNILSDTIQKENDAVQEFIDKNTEAWDGLKKAISGMIDVKKADEVLPNTTIYHGTSVANAKNILSKGVTPFSQKSASSGSGMGYGFYASPELKAAEFYSENGAVLPFKIEGNVAVLKDGVKPEDIKTNVMAMVMNIIDPAPKNKGIADLFHMPSQQAQDFAKNNQSLLTTRAMQELGIDAIYTKEATSRGGLLSSILNQAPEFLDEAGQIAVFNGDKVQLITDKAKELNPITAQNYKKFI